MILPTLYIYTDHKKQEIVFHTTANSIIEADKLCEKKLDIVISKASHIGCEILNDKKQRKELIKSLTA
jgi:hypothetical protein